MASELCLKSFVVTKVTAEDGWLRKPTTTYLSVSVLSKGGDCCCITGIACQKLDRGKHRPAIR